MNKVTKLMARDFIEEEGDEIVENNSLDSKVLRIIKSNPDGTPSSAIADTLDITVNTALKILRSLEAEREIYSNKISKTLVWYPNGRLIHPYLEIFREFKGKPYRFSIQEGRYGSIVQIQERSYSLLTGERVEGAIFVEFSSLNEFLEGLNEIRNRYDNFDNMEVKK